MDKGQNVLSYSFQRVFLLESCHFTGYEFNKNVWINILVICAYILYSIEDALVIYTFVKKFFFSLKSK